MTVLLAGSYGMKSYVLSWIFWILLLPLARCQPPPSPHPTSATNTTDLKCVPFGTCEPCPDDALHEPFCQPFGNRRLVHCVPVSAAGSLTTTSPHTHASNDLPKGETPAWESCGRIVEKERADFYEFFACNFFIALFAIAILLARSKRLQAIQARQLAARIGLVRPVPGGWSNG